MKTGIRISRSKMHFSEDNRSLTGFWIESSLKISPKEQTEVMERIFGSHSEYSKETQDKLKQVMLVSDQTAPGLAVYGKTGQGRKGILRLTAGLQDLRIRMGADFIFAYTWEGQTELMCPAQKRGRQPCKYLLIIKNVPNMYVI